MNNFQPGGKQFALDIGGSVDFAEGFKINVYQSKQNEFKYILEFRRMMVEMDYEEMKGFISC